MGTVHKPRGRLSISLSRVLICAAIIYLAHFSLSAVAQTSNVVGTDEDTTQLSIVVKGLSSQAAPLHWVVYASKDALPGIFSRGQPYKKGVAESFDDPAVIEVGGVPGGSYFAIVGQDIDGNEGIAKFSEPRGYSGYDGCLVPNWKKGSQYVQGEQASIEVVLQCNTSSLELEAGP